MRLLVVFLIVGLVGLVACTSSRDTATSTLAPLAPSTVPVAATPPPTLAVTSTTVGTIHGPVDDGALRSGSGDAGFGEGRCPQWKDAALVAGWTEELWPTLSRILYAESGCDPAAHNVEVVGDYGRAAGLAQVMDGLWPFECGLQPEQLLEPVPNLACALLVFNRQGWEAWTTY